MRIILLGSAVQFAYWGILWPPAFLSRPAYVAVWGLLGSLAGRSPRNRAYLGHLTFGFIADWLGRRRTFVLFRRRGDARAD